LMSTASRGAALEHRAKRLLEKEGWAVTRGAGSHGCADLWAAKAANYIPDWWFTVRAPHLRLIQVKGSAKGPFEHFGPKDRQALLDLAAQTGGSAELWWWPPRKPLQILHPSDWPS
jgi:Holliday junction resolvase